jgi:6-phosphogluconolactonase/glucosamine-6-phosphate isomerase/deaminase
MKIDALADADGVVQAAAAFAAAEARAAVGARGRFGVAVSGGHAPWKMLRRLASGQWCIDNRRDFRESLQKFHYGAGDAE